MRVELVPPPAPPSPTPYVRLELSVREAQILTALAGGICDFEGSSTETSDCMEAFFTKLQDQLGHTRPEGENFHALFTTSFDGIHCR